MKKLKRIFDVLLAAGVICCLFFLFGLLFAGVAGSLLPWAPLWLRMWVPFTAGGCWFLWQLAGVCERWTRAVETDQGGEDDDGGTV